MSKHLTFANLTIKNSNFDFLSENLLSQNKKLAIEAAHKSPNSLNCGGAFFISAMKSQFFMTGVRIVTWS